MRKKIEDIPAVHIANPKTAEFQVNRTGCALSRTNMYLLLFKCKDISVPLLIATALMANKRIHIQSGEWLLQYNTDISYNLISLLCSIAICSVGRIQCFSCIILSSPYSLLHWASFPALFCSPFKNLFLDLRHQHSFSLLSHKAFNKLVTSRDLHC